MNTIRYRLWISFVAASVSFSAAACDPSGLSEVGEQVLLLPEGTTMYPQGKHDFVVVACESEAIFSPTAILGALVVGGLLASLGRVDVLLGTPNAIVENAITDCEPIPYEVIGYRAQGVEVTPGVNRAVYTVQSAGEGEAYLEVTLRIDGEERVLRSEIQVQDPDSLSLTPRCTAPYGSVEVDPGEFTFVMDGSSVRLRLDHDDVEGYDMGTLTTEAGELLLDKSGDAFTFTPRQVGTYDLLREGVFARHAEQNPDFAQTSFPASVRVIAPEDIDGLHFNYSQDNTLTERPDTLEIGDLLRLQVWPTLEGEPLCTLKSLVLTLTTETPEICQFWDDSGTYHESVLLSSDLPRPGPGVYALQDGLCRFQIATEQGRVLATQEITVTRFWEPLHIEPEPAQSQGQTHYMLRAGDGDWYGTRCAEADRDVPRRCALVRTLNGRTEEVDHFMSAREDPQLSFHKLGQDLLWLREDTLMRYRPEEGQVREVTTLAGALDFEPVSLNEIYLVTNRADFYHFDGQRQTMIHESDFRAGFRDFLNHEGTIWALTQGRLARLDPIDGWVEVIGGREVRGYHGLFTYHGLPHMVTSALLRNNQVSNTFYRIEEERLTRDDMLEEEFMWSFVDYHSGGSWRLIRRQNNVLCFIGEGPRRPCQGSISDDGISYRVRSVWSDGEQVFVGTEGGVFTPAIP